ncbi:hypothetical protein O181_101083 [Austropuccinia psidii MF-1]|uniref:Reverse transcriptase domain-containing protein n=1 Tax=Austropuccinia psidii MF-1 TaxID=1389203 RepID=A0A9Q3JDT4_9BASI|nr:hypothetical protein [Austropuccinia psidii MF-1]
MDITLELDTRYHETQKEKGSHQEKKPPATGSNSSRPPQDSSSRRPPQDSSSRRPHHRKNKKGKQFQAPKDKPLSALLNKDNKLIGCEKEGDQRRVVHKNSSGINSSASNSLATAVNSVALACELKTPSLPSSAHIPSIMPSQGYGPSFLEEQWDEEEEPEEIYTVLKVVPPSYHQYLNVFSKVKAEKLPPHRSCDHHIELEGLLPPVGVIYSLSNQESEKLWAYISENVEKDFIRPSSSSTGAPVLFVKKKDGGLRLCVDYHELNAVTKKNRYPVPPMNQLVTLFNSSTIFSTIDPRGAYNLMGIKEGDFEP